MKKIIIGKEEWCSLPNLGLPFIKARVDSGAKTSSLHAMNISIHEEDNQKYVTFDVYPIQGNKKIVKRCKAELAEKRIVKCSMGIPEKRFVIKTELTLGNKNWEIEVTLTNRDSMDYRMLLGREAMHKNILINPNKSFFQGTKKDNELIKTYQRNTIKKKGLNIILLANNPDLYSNRRIIEAGEQKGHNIRFIKAKHCYMNISSKDKSMYYRGGEKLDGVDAIIPRIKPSMTYYGTSVTKQFESLNVFSLNGSAAIANLGISCLHCKYYQIIILIYPQQVLLILLWIKKN